MVDEQRGFQGIGKERNIIFKKAKKIPKEGAQIVIGGAILTVTKATERSIDEVSLRPRGKERLR